VANESIKVIAQNRKARHDYFIEETYEAGIVLSGTEVKSIRLGKVNLKDSYANIKDGEVFITTCISALMRRGIYSIEILYAAASCSSIRRRLVS